MPTYGNKKSNSYKELEKGKASCREIGCLHFVVNPWMSLRRVSSCHLIVTSVSALCLRHVIVHTPIFLTRWYLAPPRAFTMPFISSSKNIMLARA